MLKNAASTPELGWTLLSVRSLESKRGQAKSRSYFSVSKFGTEQEQRSNLEKWKTVLHATDNFLGASFQKPSFDIYYNARVSGDNSGSNAERIRDAFVMTVESKSILYYRILADPFQVDGAASASHPADQDLTGLHSVTAVR